jgi:hypothetical protein
MKNLNSLCTSLIAFCIAISLKSFSQSVNLPYLAHGSARWGLLDSDTYPDLLLTGLDSLDRPQVHLFENASGHHLNPVAHPLFPARGSMSAWIDVDSDGDADLLYGGEIAPASFQLKLYLNQSGVLALSTQSLRGLAYGSLLPGDFDGDGDMDCLASGFTARNGLAAYWLENAGGVLEERESQALPKLWYGQAETGDVDGDGDTDLVFIGLDSTDSGVLLVLKNEGNWQFQARNLPNQVLKPGFATWADIDLDGDLDLAVCGGEPSPVTRIYRNQGWQFTDAGIVLDTTQIGQLHFKDYDLDGYPDLALTGLRPQGPHTTVYHNVGGTTFLPSQPSFPLDGLYQSTLEWADFNQDGYPDFIATGLGLNHRPRSFLFQYQPNSTARFAR